MSRRSASVATSPSVVLFSSLFAAQAAILVLSPILPQVAAEFGVSTAVTAQLRAVSGITAGTAALFVAAAGSRFRLSTLLGAGLGLLAVGSGWSAAAGSFPMLMAAQVVIGLGLALVLSGGLAASEAWARENEGSKVLSWALIGQPVAWIVGQPVVGYVADRGWRWAWIAVPLVATVLAFVVLSLRDRSTSEAGGECDPVGLWQLPGVRSWAVGELLAFSAWAGTLVYAGALFIESYGTTVGVTGLILGIGAAAYLPGNFLGKRWLASGARRVLIGSALGASLCVAVFGAGRAGVIWSSAVFAVLAVFGAARTISGAALGLELARGRRLAAMSVRTATVQMGYLIGAGIGGAALSRWGYTGVGLVFAGLFCGAAIPHLARLIGARGAASQPGLG